jgi:hypothetical protein
LAKKTIEGKNMAKRECPFCKENVKESAIICMHCKSELPQLPPKKWYQTWKGLLLILFVLGIFVQAFDDHSAKSTTSTLTKTTNSIATNSSNQEPAGKTINSDGKKITDKYLASLKERKKYTKAYVTYYDRIQVGATAHTSGKEGKTLNIDLKYSLDEFVVSVAKRYLSEWKNIGFEEVKVCDEYKCWEQKIK